VALVAFGFGGLLYGPFIAASVSAIQGATPPSEQGPVMALWATLTLGALPFGTLVGGPMVAGLGTRGTFALCGILTLALGVVTLGKVVTSERSKRVAPSA